MFLSRWRILLAIGFFFYAIYLTATIGFVHSWYVFLGSILLFVMHFLFGTVWAGFNQLQKGNHDTAKIILAQNKRPEWLLKRPRAYYYFGWGIINLHEKDYQEAKANLEEALKIGLRTSTETALIYLNLGHIGFIQKAYDDAKVNLDKAKALQSTDANIQTRIKELENALTKVD